MNSTTNCAVRSVSCPSLPIREVQLVHLDRIGRLRLVSVHLKLDGDAIPVGWGRIGSERSVDVVGHAIERDRLIEHFIVGGSLKVNDHVVPGIV